MNRQRRKKIAEILKRSRTLLRKNTEEMAATLGWTHVDYVNAELGRLSLSAGQQNDVRGLLKYHAERRLRHS